MTDRTPLADLAPPDRARADRAAGTVLADLFRSLGAAGYTAEDEADAAAYWSHATNDEVDTAWAAGDPLATAEHARRIADLVGMHPDGERPTAANVDGVALCGNPRHPDGPWHPSAPVPGTWQRRERLAQWARRRAWGCGCGARTARPVETLGPLGFLVGCQAGGAPLVDDAGFGTPEGRYVGVMLRRPVRSDRRLLRPNPLAPAGPGLLVGVKVGDGPPPWWTSPQSTRGRWRRALDLALHDLVAHPLLTLWPAMGDRLHDRWTPMPSTHAGEPLGFDDVREGGTVFDADLTGMADLADGVTDVEARAEWPGDVTLDPLYVEAIADALDSSGIADALEHDARWPASTWGTAEALARGLLAREDLAVVPVEWYRDDEANRRPTLGGSIEPSGYWRLDDLPLPDGVPHALAEGAPRIALRDPEGRSWGSWRLLDALPTLRAQLDAGAELDAHRQDLYHALHLAREVLCSTQVHVPEDLPAMRRALDVAVRRIDGVGSTLCPQWSALDRTHEDVEPEDLTPATVAQAAALGVDVEDLGPSPDVAPRRIADRPQA